MKKRLILLALCLAVILTLVPGVLAAQEAAMTVNKGSHDYINAQRWADPANSFLYTNGDGTLTRVEYTGKNVTVEVYDENYEFVSGQTIEMELPIFGGFYCGDKYNFLVYGQTNPGEDDSAEVIRVVKYAKDWERLGQASLCGANTTVPFDAGGMSMAECNGYLYLRTSHTMYRSDDGLNHQANLTMNVRISDMVVTDSYYGVMNTSYGYVSHSFNQFIRVDGDDLVAVDHGDAHPRAVVLTRYYAPAGQDQFMKPVLESLGGGYYRYAYAENVEVLPIGGSYDYDGNDTGVCVGGFEVSDTSYLVAGTTIHQDGEFDEYDQRNVFVSVTPKDDFTAKATKLVYLTDYEAGDLVASLSNPHLVKISDDKFMVLWETLGVTLCYTFIDGNGNQIGETYTFKGGCLSDCAPIVADGKVVWYVTRSSEPAFFTIDLENPSEVTHDCIYIYYLKDNRWPTETESATAVLSCTVCDSTTEQTLPPYSDPGYTVNKLWEETCTMNGRAVYSYTLPGYLKVALTDTYAARHIKGEHLGSAEAKCEEGAYDEYRCSRCGNDYKDYTSEALGHAYGEWTLPEGAVCGRYVDYYRTCSRCEKTETTSIFYEHDYETIIDEPTCTENGQMRLQCSRCADVHHTETYGHATGHDWGDETIHGLPCQGTAYGEKICANCGESSIQQYDYVYEHDYVDLDGQPQCASKCSWCGAERGHVYDDWITIALWECRYCGAYALMENDELVPHTHTFGPWEESKIFADTWERSCTVCGMVGESADRLPDETEPPAETKPGDPKPADPKPSDPGPSEPSGQSNPFVDVKAGAYYYDSVLWAVDNSITTGMDATHFGPEAGCTRGHVVTFLWRAAGEPAPGTDENPFVDVKPGAYYYEAVLWAVENGITMGMDATHFAPDATCTRGQIVTFLWRFSGSPEADADVAFADVPDGQYYTTAVAWAVENEITNGMGNNRFQPDSTCTRGQIVTFLYRAMG